MDYLIYLVNRHCNHQGLHRLNFLFQVCSLWHNIAVGWNNLYACKLYTFGQEEQEYTDKRIKEWQSSVFFSKQIFKCEGSGREHLSMSCCARLFPDLINLIGWMVQ